MKVAVQLLEFKGECRLFLIATVKKIQDKAPTQYRVVTNAACLHPKKLHQASQSSSDDYHSSSQMKRLMRSFVDANILQANKCDEIAREFDEFISVTVPQHKAKFRDFSLGSDRIDSLFYETMAKPHKVLWHCIVQPIIVMK